MKTLIVEGWRFCPNSFSVLNQHQLLEMLKRPDLKVYHRDLPYDASWWKWERGLLPEADEAAIEAIPPPPTGLRADALLRISHPYRLEPSPEAKRTFVFGTAELGIVEDLKMVGGQPARQLLPGRNVSYITCSRFSAQGFVRSGAAPDNVAVVHLGYDPRVFKPASAADREALRQSMGWSGRMVFLNVSTMSWYKGLNVMLVCFGMFAQRHPEALLVVKGSDSLWQMDKRLAGGLEQIPPQLAEIVRPRIQYLGKTMAHGEIARLYQAADAYLSPYHGEGFNLPVLESAACGLPSIVTAGGPTEEFTTEEFALRVNSHPMTNADLERSHGRGAIALVVHGDHLLEQMERATSDTAFRARAAVAGPEYVSQRHTWKHTVDQLVEAMMSEVPLRHPAFRWAAPRDAGGEFPGW